MSLRAIGHARTGLELARARLDASAHNTANALTDGFRQVRVTGAEAADGGVEARVSRASAPGADAVADVVERKSAAVLYRANLSVIRANDTLLGEVVDLVG